MFSTNCINCCFNAGDGCLAVVGADPEFIKNCTFKKTQEEFNAQEYKTCARLAKLADTSSGKAKLYDIFLKYDTTVKAMKRYGFSSVVSLVNQV